MWFDIRLFNSYVFGCFWVVVFYKIKCRTSFWTQTGTIALKKQDAATQKALKLLSYGRPHILIEDYNGNFRLAGAQNGVEVSVGTATGGAMGDLNGYNITFEGKEKEPAYFVDSAIVGTGLDFDVNATVINP